MSEQAYPLSSVSHCGSVADTASQWHALDCCVNSADPSDRYNIVAPHALAGYACYIFALI